jgi:lipopolysaccharide biosynthesis protein
MISQNLKSFRDEVMSYFLAQYGLKDPLTSNEEGFFAHFLQAISEGRINDTYDLKISDEHFLHQVNRLDYEFTKLFFDEKFYRKSNTDVESSGIDPFKHYMSTGWREGRDPTPDFSSYFYLENHEDVRQHGVNPFLHWALHGRVEQRVTKPPLNDKSMWKDVASNSVLLYSPVETYCFYLPQFHEIPENNAWWGDGFTEWTNTEKTLAMFHGHRQPRKPSDLGYYDLSKVCSIRKQAELARSYGISGFTFYYYWFDGARLLETPMDLLISNKDIDIKFNICWANENWTRTWDGLEKDVLIAQKHSAKNDRKIIKDMIPIMMDGRYTRVNGKPLVTIYRPDQLPDPNRTADIWRKTCRKAGVGEIYLCSTTSFINHDPTEIGFDAVIEFPPNNTAPKTAAIDECLWHHANEKRPAVFSLESVARGSEQYSSENYRIHRGVCPQWDNSARKGNQATIFVHDDPHIFEKWCDNAISDIVQSYSERSQRLLFINAWNEWAEGAYLEPDNVKGYEYLEALKKALQKHGALAAEYVGGHDRIQEDITGKKLAVILHAYYTDGIESVILKIAAEYPLIKFFISCPTDKQIELEGIISGLDIKSAIMPMENRGRDVRPFFKAVKLAYKEGYKYILKLHMKKSTHREDGEQWRNSLFDGLLGKNLASALRIFEKDPRSGLIGPNAHYLSLSFFLASNYGNLHTIASAFDVKLEDYLNCGFFAGTMFYIRTEAAVQFVRKLEGSVIFESETGQTDGTIAHAIERSFCIFCASHNFSVYGIETEKKLLSSFHSVHGRPGEEYDHAAQAS